MEQLQPLVTGSTPLDKPSLADVAYKRLEEMIVTLKLPPGTTVSEANLSKHLGIGRTPVREALQRLAYEGTIVILPRCGVVVSEINITNQLKLVGVRRELERYVATCAARRANAEQKQQFLDLVAEFETAAQQNDEIHFIRTDSEFDALVLAVAQNEYARNAIIPLRAHCRRFWHIHFKKAGSLPKLSRLHADVARAIAANDVARAAAASDLLMDYVEENTRASLDANH